MEHYNLLVVQYLLFIISVLSHRYSFYLIANILHPLAKYTCLKYSVWFNTMSSRIDGIGICKCLTENAIFVCPSILLFHCMPWFFSGKWWHLTCVQHTSRLTHMQHMKYYSHACYYCEAHGVWVLCCYATHKI